MGHHLYLGFVVILGVQEYQALQARIEASLREIDLLSQALIDRNTVINAFQVCMLQRDLAAALADTEPRHRVYAET